VIATRTFVCTIGNAPNPVAKHTIAAGKFDEATVNGRGICVFETDAMLQCKGKAGYSAVGDCAGVPSPTGKGFAPPTAQFAIREAKACAHNLVATIDHKPLVTFFSSASPLHDPLPPGGGVLCAACAPSPAEHGTFPASMPTLALFFGITVRMYYDDHAPPHFHAYYGGHAAQIGIETLDILQGQLPRRALALVVEWALVHRPELRDNWTRAERHEALLPIEPLE